MKFFEPGNDLHRGGFANVAGVGLRLSQRCHLIGQFPAIGPPAEPLVVRTKKTLRHPIQLKKSASHQQGE
jgi:hypothetical protein